MKIIVHAKLPPEYMFDKGRLAGLSEKAANFFRYFSEIPIELDVTPKGSVVGGKILLIFDAQAKEE